MEEEKVETAVEETKEESSKSEEKKEVIWGQLRVPNIKKGYNPNYPFYMMGILVGIVILSFIFAKLTS